MRRTPRVGTPDRHPHGGPGGAARTAAADPVPAGARPVRASPEPIDRNLLRATATLRAQRRAAIVLYHYEDRPIADIAALLDCSVSAAKVLLHRARRTLAALLTDEERDDVR